jgi:hypothetical protein
MQDLNYYVCCLSDVCIFRNFLGSTGRGEVTQPSCHTTKMTSAEVVSRRAPDTEIVSWESFATSSMLTTCRTMTQRVDNAVWECPICNLVVKVSIDRLAFRKAKQTHSEQDLRATATQR